MVVNCVLYSAGHPVQNIEINEIRSHLGQQDSFIWLGLYEPNEELMKEVQKAFGLHDLAVEDAHNAHQRPKIEAYGDSLFLVLHTAQKNQDKVEYGETHVFIGYGYIVTVRHGASLPYTTVRERCEKTPEHLCRGPGFPLYAVMDFVVDNYLPIVEEFEDELVALEETIFKGNSHEDTTERIYDLKREIMGLRRATVPLLEVCNNLTRVTTPLLTAEVQPYFRDVHDHVVRINEAMETLREMLNTAFQVNLSLVTMKQNDVVKKLAGWAGLLGVPTMMASFYGMNFKYMPELEWQYGYPTLMAVMISACLFLYYRLKKSDWL